MMRRFHAHAPVAEPVDALDSKSGAGNSVPVRVGPGAPFCLDAMGCRTAEHRVRLFPTARLEVQAFRIAPGFSGASTTPRAVGLPR
jgi:hypothetical protein